MEDLIDLSWRIYPASLLMTGGASLFALGMAKEWRGLRLALSGDPAKILTFLLGFRFSIIGLALAGIGAAWAWHLTVVLVLALVIGGEELLESSAHIFAVRRGQRLTALGSNQRNAEGVMDWKRLQNG